MSNSNQIPVDGNFYKRADAHIALANDHANDTTPPADANNSLMFASSRFNAWITAAGFKNAEEMKAEKQEVLDFFTKQYRHMLDENFDNYAENFEQFINGTKESQEKK